MRVDPFQRFLGVESSSGPMKLLGLRAQRCDVSSVAAALEVRLRQVDHHPGGRSREAQQVRRRLCQVADTLGASIERAGKPAAVSPTSRSSPPAPAPAVIHSIAADTLTDFDRHVLAVLVGCGGWNAITRSKLVGLAGAYGVSVQGLMRVVAGLSEYAKSGGPRLGTAEITSGAARVAALPTVAPRQGEAESLRLTGFTPQLGQDSASTTIKLSLLFGLLTLVVAMVAARFLLFPGQSHRFTPAEETTASPPLKSPWTSTPTEPTKAADDRPATPPTHRLARFSQPPTFLGRALSPETARAADECSQLPQEIETVARRIAISDDPSEAVYRAWDDFMRTVGIGWAMIDDDTRAAIDRAIFEALYEASDSPSVADRLLRALMPPSGRLADPNDLWRGAWMAGTLARISSSANLSPAVIDRARTHLDIALNRRALQAAADFNSAAGAWLDGTVATLIDVMESDERIYDFWECWIAVQARLGRGDRLSAAVMFGIEAVLRSSTDLSRPGPGVNVLGRLLSMSDFDSSRIVKDRLREFFEDDQRISTQDLWVLTSLLAESGAASWFSDDLVLPSDGDWMFRRRTADRISQRWPHAAWAVAEPNAEAPGLPVDPVLAARWLTLSQSQLHRPLAGEPERLMDQLVIACRLNEAVSWMVAREEAQARQLLDRLELIEVAGPGGTSSAGAGASSVNPTRPGGPTGRDGEWATAFEQAGRKTEERVQRLRVLRNSAGVDLGPKDAEALVRAVYHSSWEDVRKLAQSVVVERFTTGANVALQMLDQFPGASASQRTAETIGRFTGRLLPRGRSESWAIDARLSLVEHALSLQRLGPGRIDQQTAAVVESYLNRQAAMRPRGSSSDTAGTAHGVAQGLLKAWRDRAALARVADPVPGDLNELQRRHAARLRLTQGSLQRFVATQVGLLEMMTYLAVAEQLGLREPLADLLAESARRRAGMTHVLAQAVDVERAIARLWQAQLGVNDPSEANR